MTKFSTNQKLEPLIARVSGLHRHIGSDVVAGIAGTSSLDGWLGNKSSCVVGLAPTQLIINYIESWAIYIFLFVLSILFMVLLHLT